jgi:hypothetical protein
MRKTYKRLTENECYKSFRSYERTIEAEVKAGLILKSDARLLIDSARKNYQKQNYNRQVDIINEN